MKTRYIFPILLFIPLLILQTTIIPLFAFYNATPDLILILLVFYSISYGQVYGTVLGFVFGFLFDLITGSLLGSAMLSKTIAGFIAGYFSNENKKDIYAGSYVFSFIVMLCAIVDSIVYSFFSTTELQRNFLLLFFEQGFLPGLYTAIISISVIVFLPGRRLS
ncbi:MAG: rod shape-determining protein MreD [Ignavibacteria bacterium GWA2_35_9]|nr:MAG: rod shape-determining protein MreD [Ignavibacteria bacterium GWA2_35_9]OGU48818.1 MAG: rod shape-determining protein MreD [Ignavibacteria bacterium GWB2_36_8]OGU48958.1 MAG: rod shape-determining protein MreD [Ignavibacteria bacterium GWC2_36_12]